MLSSGFAGAISDPRVTSISRGDARGCLPSQGSGSGMGRGRVAVADARHPESSLATSSALKWTSSRRKPSTISSCRTPPIRMCANDEQRRKRHRGDLAVLVPVEGEEKLYPICKPEVWDKYVLDFEVFPPITKEVRKQGSEGLLDAVERSSTKFN